jgi:glyoxylase-like metal-dependent hydrolase (beta-lactamase superfamily II)
MQLTDRVYLVGSGAAGFSLTHPTDCHVYLIDGGTEVALVDAGTGLGTAEIVDNIRAHGFDLFDVRSLFLTHLHADHAGGAARLQRLLPNVQVMASQAGADWLRRGDEQAISLDKGKQGGFYAPEYRFEPCPVAVELADGQSVAVGDMAIQILDVPGHCRGHVALLIRYAGLTYLFAGDALFFGGKILLQSIWDCDLQEHLRSIQRLAGLEVDVFLPGHGAFSLRDGQRHIDAANGWIERCLVPPSFL